MNIVCFGGGEIWEKGIKPALEGLGHTVKCFSRDEVDVTDPSAVSTALMIRNSDDESPVFIDWVIYTAGVSHPTRLIGIEPIKLLHEMMVNVVGAFYVANAMKMFQSSNFIGITSVAGLYGKPEHSGYSASKAALRSLIQSMSFEGINAYGIAPGRVNTQMRHRDYPNEHVETRLDPSEIGLLVLDIMSGKYKSGDNIILRRIGHETQPIKVDNGEPWRTELKIGQPPVC